MTTFSQLVDDMVLETRRPDMRREIITYLNQTIREVHADPQRNNGIMYRANFTEELLTATSASGFTYEIPDMTRWQAMQVVQFLASGVYPPEVIPSRALATKDYYYYRAGNFYHFSGFGGAQSQIAIGYYLYPRRLAYHAPGIRPAEYDPELGWVYNVAFDSTNELRTYAREMVTNWLLMRWVDVISEGLRAKIYKRISDDTRAKTCYSLFSSLRQGLLSNESADLGGYA
jgi:hypothetical protein